MRNRISRWGGVARATQSRSNTQHHAEMKNSGFGLRTASVWILAPLLNRCVMDSDRQGQQVASWVPVRDDACWYLRLCQLTHPKWTTPTPFHGPGPWLSVLEERLRSGYLTWGEVSGESPSHAWPRRPQIEHTTPVPYGSPDPIPQLCDLVALGRTCKAVC